MSVVPSLNLLPQNTLGPARLFRESFDDAPQANRHGAARCGMPNDVPGLSTVCRQAQRWPRARSREGLIPKPIEDSSVFRSVGWLNARSRAPRYVGGRSGL
jgi:hypothetical protein